MSVDSFSKGIVEIISSSKDAERVENEILQVFNALSKSSEALDAVSYTHLRAHET